MRRTLAKAVVLTAGLSFTYASLNAHHESETTVFAGTPNGVKAPVPAFKFVNNDANSAKHSITPIDATRPENLKAEEIIKNLIIPRLGEIGLKIFEADDGVNGSNEFMVKVSEDCGSQVEVVRSAETPDKFNTSATVFGKLAILKSFNKKPHIFPEYDGQLAHQESDLNLGFDFNPLDEASLTDALGNIARTTKFVCHGLGLSDKL